MSPRPFTERERERIRAKLLDAAGSHFAQYGYRRASMADIAAEVGIGKGSLYLFYPSKVELFIAVALRVEESCRRQLMDEMAVAFPSPQARLAHFLRFSTKLLQENPLLSVMTDAQEAAALQRDLPPEMQEGLRGGDDEFFRGLASRWQRDGLMGDVDLNVFVALPRALFALILQREIIGMDAFPALMDFIIDSASRSLAPLGKLDT